MNLLQTDRVVHQMDTLKPIDQGDGVRAVGRALDVLLAFRAGEADLSASELLTRLHLSRPTLYRLLHTLEQRGFIASVGEPQRFRLGPAVVQLAHVWTASMNLGQVAMPVMRALWQMTGETVALFVPQGAHRQCVAELPSPQPLSFKRGAGYSERIVLGASGRVMLAFDGSTDAQIRASAKGLELDLPGTLREVKATAIRGYGVSRSELIEGAVAIAAPFFDGSGKLAGSLAVFGPEVRMGKDRIASIGAMLVREGRTLSAALGYRGPK
jgi:DNA-binding IclR family transcriptional regulator